jgi:hypothetical protein
MTSTQKSSRSWFHSSTRLLRSLCQH